MRYENDRLCFSLTLPDDWRLAPNTMPPTFISGHGYILVKANTILPEFATAASRKQHMAELGVVFRDAYFLGDEVNNVVRLDNSNVNEGWVSAVREGIHHEVS